MQDFKIIAFTHKNLLLDEIGLLHLDVTNQQTILPELKNKLQLKELMYLSTCNRVEFLFANDKPVTRDFIKQLVQIVNPKNGSDLVSNAQLYVGVEAVNHIFKVASSIDSLVVGEREIITQVRNSFEIAKKFGLSGDLIRLVIRKTIETAKLVYTQTSIASNPVSITSLAYKKLKFLEIGKEARILIVGTGQTNRSMVRFLKKHGYRNFSVYNRTLENADLIARDLNCEPKLLAELKNHTTGFDIMLTCTGSSDVIINNELYSKLIQSDTSKKVVIDLAIPNDVAKEVIQKNNIVSITINELKVIAEANMSIREKELVKCDEILDEQLEEFRRSFHTRKVELAMQNIPTEVKKIKSTAITEVFAKDLQNLDANSKELLDKILSYMEKKYISVPMKLAKDILLDEQYKKK